MAGDADYFEITCCKCGVLHWIPVGLWEVCVATKNDDFPRNAFCPYGHPYVAARDKAQPETGKLPPPQPLKPQPKKPRRFWERKPKDSNNNVITLKDHQ